MGPDFEFIHFPCRGHCSWSNRYNPDEVLWRVYTSMAICRNHCVLLHCFLSSRSDAVDDSNGYCVRNLVRYWNRINQPFGLVGKWAKAGFPGDRRHVPDLRWGSGYQYFFKIFPALILKECRISGAVREGANKSLIWDHVCHLEPWNRVHHESSTYLRRQWIQQ